MTTQTTSSPFVVLVRGDDGPDPYGPYEEDEAHAVAVRIEDATGLEAEVLPLRPWTLALEPRQSDG
jgi:hypothetical protein